MKNTKFTNLLKYLTLTALIILSAVALYIIGVIISQISLFTLGVILISEIIILFTSKKVFSHLRAIYYSRK